MLMMKTTIKNINDKLNDRIVQETNESRQSTEDDEEFLLIIGVNNNLKPLVILKA